MPPEHPQGESTLSEGDISPELSAARREAVEWRDKCEAAEWSNQDSQTVGPQKH